jgi:signal transduction histidine kinase
VGSDSFPGAFRRYFVLDSILVLLVFAVGRFMPSDYRFDAFCWLLLANTILYTGYDLTAIRRRYLIVLLLPLGVAALLFLQLQPGGLPLWLLLPLQIAPVGAACMLSVLAVYTITRSRRVDALRVDEYMQTLGHIVVALSPPDFKSATAAQQTADYKDYRDAEFRTRLIKALQLVCSREHFWFRSACLWLAEYHHDRKDVLVPVAYYNIPAAMRGYREGVETVQGFLSADTPVLVRSLREVSKTPTELDRWRFRVDEDIPAALIPMYKAGRPLGVLVLYGEEQGVPVVAADRTFLVSLAATIGSALEQWETFLRALALDELDALFGCDSIDNLLQQADKLIKRYLSARGCMIVFRPDPLQAAMHVHAIEGFRASMLHARYDSGTGLTGRCAETGQVIRIDDVALHRAEFDSPLFRRLERSHGGPVRSWMALPIGQPGRNYGVIKAINSAYPCSWFTAFDQRLGSDIAARLHVMIDKILHVERTEEAKRRAEKSEGAALAAQRQAEDTAKRREQDIMTVMHQLQLPLLGISNALTAVEPETLSTFDADMVTYAQLLVEDSLALGFGTLTVFAKEAGQQTVFQETEIDASEELRGLARRLQRTQDRDDLTFRFKLEPDFPKLRMDSAIFASVFYSLLHNAMKYAHPGSEVILECGFEGVADVSVRWPALKVKTIGEPIDPAERDAVFDKFVRGKSVAHGKLYRGVGLGLWVARGLMEMLGGHLYLELSHDYPERTVFVVQIPGSEHYA